MCMYIIIYIINMYIYIYLFIYSFVHTHNIWQVWTQPPLDTQLLFDATSAAVGRTPRTYPFYLWADQESEGFQCSCSWHLCHLQERCNNKLKLETVINSTFHFWGKSPNMSNITYKRSAIMWLGNWTSRNVNHASTWFKPGPMTLLMALTGNPA